MVELTATCFQAEVQLLSCKNAGPGQADIAMNSIKSDPKLIIVSLETISGNSQNLTVPYSRGQKMIEVKINSNENITNIKIAPIVSVVSNDRCGDKICAYSETIPCS